MKWFTAIGFIVFMSAVTIYALISNDEPLSSHTVKFHDDITLVMDYSEVKVFLDRDKKSYLPSNRVNTVASSMARNVKENRDNQVDMISSIESTNIDLLLQIEGVKPVSFLTVEEDEIEALDEGSILTIPVEGFLYKMEIKKINHFQDISKIYHLLFAGDEGFGGVMTQKANTLLLTFDTPNGTYEGIVYQGRGVIYRSDEIEHQLSDTRIKDTL